MARSPHAKLGRGSRPLSEFRTEHLTTEICPRQSRSAVMSVDCLAPVSWSSSIVDHLLGYGFCSARAASGHRVIVGNMNTVLATESRAFPRPSGAETADPSRGIHSPRHGSCSTHPEWSAPGNRVVGSFRGVSALGAAATHSMKPLRSDEPADDENHQADHQRVLLREDLVAHGYRDLATREDSEPRRAVVEWPNRADSRLLPPP